MRSRRRLLGLVLLVGAALACGPAAPGEDPVDTSVGTTRPTSTTTPTTGAGPTTTSGTTTTSGGTTTIRGETSTGASTTDISTSGEVCPPDPSDNNFIPGRDASVDLECDNFAQTCPPGQKCSAYANDGGNSWNSLKCVPVMDNPAQAGDPCFVIDSGVSGVDNCDLGAMCWDTDAENQGICVPLCAGTPDAPLCAPGFTCAITNGGVLNRCVDACDPLAQDCPVSDVCIPNPVDDGFLCVLDSSTDSGVAHDPCYYANQCDPGLYCADPATAHECDKCEIGCCEPFCDLTAPNMCPGSGQVCTPWFAEGEAPEGYERVGACALPL